MSRRRRPAHRVPPASVPGNEGSVDISTLTASEFQTTTAVRRGAGKGTLPKPGGAVIRGYLRRSTSSTWPSPTGPYGTRTSSAGPQTHCKRQCGMPDFRSNTASDTRPSTGSTTQHERSTAHLARPCRLPSKQSAECDSNPTMTSPTARSAPSTTVGRSPGCGRSGQPSSPRLQRRNGQPHRQRDRGRGLHDTETGQPL